MSVYVIQGNRTVDDVVEVVESVGIPVRQDGWAPLKPPPAPYAVVRDTEYRFGSDLHVGVVQHETMIYLYDEGGADGRALRRRLADALSGANFPHYQRPASYAYDLKLFETAFDLEEYNEKWSG